MRWGDAAGAAAPVRDAADEEAVVQLLAGTAISLAFLADFYATCVEPIAGGSAMTTKGALPRCQYVEPRRNDPPAYAPPAGCADASRLRRGCGADRQAVGQDAAETFLGGPPSARCGQARGGACAAACGLRPACWLTPGRSRTQFASHAFGNPFSLLVASLQAHFRDAVASECFLWVDIFTINQHDPGADLHDGRTLAATIATCATVAVVLDAGTLPLSRLWCLYEIGSTPPEKLVLLTHGFDASVLSAAFERIDVAAADCYAQRDKRMIRGLVRSRHRSLDAFTRLLKLLLVLKPMSYTDDVKALLARADDAFDFSAAAAFLAPGGRLACIAGGPGEGKSTLAAALLRPSASALHGCWRASGAEAGGARAGAAAQVAHFCKAADVRRQDVGGVMRSLAYQLALLHAPFAERLLRLTRAEVEALQAPAEAWRLLLQQPLAACGRGLRAVVLLDALDEAAAPDRPVSAVLRLLLDLGGLPGCALSFVVTTRPEDAILAPLRRRWGEAFRLFAPAELRRGADAAAAGAPGHAPLLRTLRAELAAARPGAAPPGSLDDAYAAFFCAADLAAHARALAALVAARQPPALADLEAMRLRAAVRALPGWGTLFIEREHRVHLLHRSVAEWLLRAGGVSAADGHAALAAYLWDEQLRPWLFPAGAPAAAPPPGSYVLSHAVAHLRAAGRRADAAALPLRLPWLQATLRARGLKPLLDDVAALAQPGDGTLSPLLSVLRLAAPVLLGLDAAACLPAQLAGRLRAGALAPELAALAAEARAWRGEVPWLRLLAPTLRGPGALENTCVCAGGVTALALLPDGRIASGGDDALLRVWRADTGECEATLAGHTQPVYAVGPLPSGRQIVSGSYDFTLRVWDVHTGECERELSGHTDRVNAVAALPGGGTVASASCDHTIRLWDVASGAHAATLEGHTEAVWTLAVLPPPPGAAADAPVLLASSSEDFTIRIWDVATGTCGAVLDGHSDGVCGLTALADGRLVSASRDTTLRVWARDGQRGTWACAGTLRGHTGEIYAVADLGDGRVASGSLDKSVRVWDTSAEGDAACVITLSGHTDTVLAVGRLPSGRIMSASEDRSLRIWDPAAAAAADADADAGHSARVNAAALLPGGVVVTASDDETLRVWAAASGTCAATLRGHGAPVNALAVLRDGRCASAAGCRWSIYDRSAYGTAAYSPDNSLRVWDVAARRCDAVLLGHATAARALVALPDGRLASGGEDATVRIWAAAAAAPGAPGDWACDAVLEGHASFVDALAVLRDGRLASRTLAADFSRYGANFADCNRARETRAWRRRAAGGAWEGALVAAPTREMDDALEGPGPVPCEHSFVTLPGAARLFVDAEVTRALRACADTRIVVATAAGGVHFAELVPKAA